MLQIRPITLKQANAYVAKLHRHNKPTNGGKFAVSCWEKMICTELLSLVNQLRGH
jgi:hypothetical protein